MITFIPIVTLHVGCKSFKAPSVLIRSCEDCPSLVIHRSAEFWECGMSMSDFSRRSDSKPSWQASSCCLQMSWLAILSYSRNISLGNIVGKQSSPGNSIMTGSALWCVSTIRSDICLFPLCWSTSDTEVYIRAVRWDLPWSGNRCP